MIREFQRDDINKVADIWLDTNIKAHNFIPAEYWKSNFKSVKEEVHDQQGVGIGLYLAREIVTRQGGYIKVVSELRQGSEFSIMLPVR